MTELPKPLMYWADDCCTQCNGNQLIEKQLAGESEPQWIRCTRCLGSGKEPITCPECNGTGTFCTPYMRHLILYPMGVCQHCDGSGRIQAEYSTDH